MANPTELAALVGAAKGGVLTLDPPGKEFQGPLIIRKPITINGQGGTIWAEKGPVLLVESSGVVLNELNVEVTGTESGLAGEEACALVARTASAPTLDRVAVRGHVSGIPGEEGEWHYPRIVRLNRIKAGATHSFTLRMVVPVVCKIESLIAGVTVAPTTLTPGEVEIGLRLESMSDGIRLRGLLKLSTGRLTRRIELSGHVSADGPGVVTGTGQAVYQPPAWSGTAAPAPAVPPPSATVPPPSPRPTPPPIPTPVPPTATVPPPPVVPPPAAPPPVPPTPPKPKSRYRFPTTVGGAFGEAPPAPEPEAEPFAEEIAESPPEATPPPEPPPTEPPSPGSDPLKKTGRRQIKRLPGLFGDSPPTE